MVETYFHYSSEHFLDKFYQLGRKKKCYNASDGWYISNKYKKDDKCIFCCHNIKISMHSIALKNIYQQNLPLI